MVGAARRHGGRDGRPPVACCSAPYGFLARRRLRRQARDLLRGPRGPDDRAELHAWLLAARDQLAAWRERSRDGRSPHVGAHLSDATQAAEAVAVRLLTLVESNPRTADLAELPYAEAGRRLAVLATDETLLAAIPRLSQRRIELSAAGLDDLLDVLHGRGTSPDTAVAAFDYARESRCSTGGGPRTRRSATSTGWRTSASSSSSAPSIWTCSAPR